MKEINVMQCGATGDGIVDDYNAIQKALMNGNCTVVIPKGRYRISGPLKIYSDTEIIASDDAFIFHCEKKPKKRGDYLITNEDFLSGNTNISITGGVWSGNYDGLNNSKNNDLFDENACSGCVINFINVRNLKLKNMTIADSVTYFTRFGEVDGFEIRDIGFKSSFPMINHDGLHFGGGCKNGIIENISAISDGETGDDLLAFNADDCVTRLENRDLIRGGIENISVKNVYAKNCHCAVRLASISSPIKNITIENIHIGCRSSAVNMDALRYCRTPLLKENEYPYGAGEIENVTIRKMEAWYSQKNTEGALIRAETLSSRFNLENFSRPMEKDMSQNSPTVRVKNISKSEFSITYNNKTVLFPVSEKSQEIEINEPFSDFMLYKSE